MKRSYGTATILTQVQWLIKRCAREKGPIELQHFFKLNSLLNRSHFQAYWSSSLQVYSLHLSYTANKVLFKDPFKPFGMNPFSI